MWPVRAVVGPWTVGAHTGTSRPPRPVHVPSYRSKSCGVLEGRRREGPRLCARGRQCDGTGRSELTEEGLPARWGGQLRLQGIRTFRSRDTAPRLTASVGGGRRSRCQLRDFRTSMGLNGQGELPPSLRRGPRWWFACTAGPSVRGAEQRQGAAGWGCTVFSCQGRSEAHGPRGGTSSAIAPGLAVPLSS